MSKLLLATSVAQAVAMAAQPIRARTRDNGMGMHTFDSRTVDSTGAFLLGELERLDQTMHDPLVSVTWGRDIDLRSDVSIADETSSFTNSTFAAAGGPSGGGKSWVGKNTDAIAGIALDIGKTAQPLTLWATQIGWTLPELESARAVGRPVDSQKYSGLLLKHQMDVDEQVYIGDEVIGVEGLLNSSKVGATNVNKNWKLATPQEILDDVNLILNNAWVASGFAVCPDKLLLPPVQFSLLTSRIVSEAGNISILEFLKANSLSNSVNGRPLDIQPSKWCVKRGVGDTDRMLTYTQSENRVRFPMVPLQRTPIEYRDLRQLTTYFGRLGAVEWVYPETAYYADGL
ncbi:DUF2184 domain-containing protein [Acinetobacter sp. WCHAc060033]|uniref:DUF2184 domain-containing protein n=1 Tax=Acinetobacter sp. WCHAc060033 TaxID=2518624 RepID=UPI001022F17B|nr:DUF2184 domain-containing protein [Acinetobacter sp. WCHAc060033]RZG78614.1 DUF2184 domain-containing protein [Acinetobacter sp. WCHAc060033]